MTILSITFHTTEKKVSEWKIFFYKSVIPLIKSNRYIISEIESDMITDGKNTNLLLFFGQKQERNKFLQKDIANISEMIYSAFENEVMVFSSILHPIKVSL